MKKVVINGGQKMKPIMKPKSNKQKKIRLTRPFT